MNAILMMQTAQECVLFPHHMLMWQQSNIWVPSMSTCMYLLSCVNCQANFIGFIYTEMSCLKLEELTQFGTATLLICKNTVNFNSSFMPAIVDCNLNMSNCAVFCLIVQLWSCGSTFWQNLNSPSMYHLWHFMKLLLCAKVRVMKRCKKQEWTAGPANDCKLHNCIKPYDIIIPV